MQNAALHSAGRYLRSPMFKLKLKRFVKSVTQLFWHGILSYKVFLVALVVYAVWLGSEKKTVISAFHLPPETRERPLPFGGETVANMLRDALTAIRKEAEGQPLSPPCDVPVSKHKEEFGGVTAGAGSAFQVGGYVGVEIRGISVAALVSMAREVLRRETSISGDVLLDGPDKIRLIARADDAGAWDVAPQSLSAEGLKIASCELAEQIWESTDKNLWAAVLIRREKYEAVIDLYNAMPVDERDADALNNLGVALRETEKIDDSIVKFHRALSLRKKFPEARYNLGLALDYRGEHRAAIAEYSAALRLKPDYPEAHNNLGNAFHSLGEHEAAIAEYHEALRLKPDYPDAHYNLGVVLGVKGEREAAAAEYREALRLKPDYPEAHNNLGNALYDKGEHKAAIAEYRAALLLRPDYLEAHYNLSIALDENGQHKEAVAECKKAVALKPDVRRLHPCPEI